MPKVALYNISGEQVGEIELSDGVFGIPVHRQALHDAVVMQQASRRQGTHDTKTRGEIRGGGRKPWRQKGTGRARHGSTRSPIWRGGGTVFGPHPRDYSYKLPRKVYRLALRSALSSKVEDGKILVLDELKLTMPRTREMVRILDNLRVDGPALVVISGRDENVIKSARNIPGIKPVSTEGLNVYDLLAHGMLVITRDAVSRVEEALA
ncbi:50S ribosomal protein L4 [Desulfotomaculum copahuensis]|uniref:Large ribosomal subunit protein uL4 n=1 Tax=Desulfotomaculum copahuensis TaxID=1838280 RepID=A0A1B7LDK2_9FIRM|nr:50S ribosomal protein L4 [Desulfotomaculum copahuensis]OAT81146.1 50S ribosomal protein L4 [Desulfotomaculum copahuensis]